MVTTPLSMLEDIVDLRAGYTLTRRSSFLPNLETRGMNILYHTCDDLVRYGLLSAEASFQAK